MISSPSHRSIEPAVPAGGAARSIARSARAIGVAACALGLLVGCDKMGEGNKGQTGGSAAGSAATTESTGAIKVGHYGSITGSEATFGISTDNGIKLAIKERNAVGGVKGRKIELVTLDTASKAAEAGTVVTRLINNEKVVAVLGEVASSASLAGGRVAQQYGVPMISPSSTNVRVTQLGDMVFRVCFIDSFQGYVAARFARDNLKADKIAILYDQGQAYSQGLAGDFEKAFIELGGKITTKQAYTGGDTDVSAQLQSIKDTAPQAVFLPGYYTEAGNFLRQARKLGIKAPFIGGDGWDSIKLTEIGGDAVEGSYYSNHYSADDPRPEVQDFVKKYKADFGEVPDGLAALGYDSARVLFAAMDKAPSLGGKDLAAAIAATKDFPGVTGNITIDADRNAVKAAVVLEIKGGKPVFVASIGPKGSEPAAPPINQTGNETGKAPAAVPAVEPSAPAPATKDESGKAAPAKAGAAADKKAGAAADKKKPAAAGAADSGW
jgi:branched-chain amino acid transport system substrate-binding protein